MSLRSPAENENGGISFHRVPSSTRHSRARGNPGLLRRISLDTRFRGYDGTQAGLFVLIPKRVFSKEITKDTKVFVGCASRTGRSRNVSRKDAKEEHCHFERREKSFLDPSHSLGMTVSNPSLSVLARGISESEGFRRPENLRKPRKLSWIVVQSSQRGYAATKMRKVGFTTKARRTRRFS